MGHGEAGTGIAGELGLTHFLELDDDYSGFMFRRIEGKKMTHHMCKKWAQAIRGCITILHGTSVRQRFSTRSGERTKNDARICNHVATNLKKELAANYGKQSNRQAFYYAVDAL